MLYVAFTSAGPFDIGDFESTDAAREWAVERFGADLEEVAPQPTTAITVTAAPPISPWVLIAGAAIMLAIFGRRL